MQNLRITYIERESKSTANEKAIEILGNTKEYIKALQHESPVPEIQYAETDPEHPIKDLQTQEEPDLSSGIQLDEKHQTEQFVIGLAETGTNSVSKFIKAKLGNLKLVGNQFITISPEGNANILGAKTDEDETRITDGVLEAVGSGLAAAGTVASIIIVTHAGVATVSAIVITTGTSAVVYNLSNMLEGIQDIYYGSKGREDESAKIIHIYSLKYSLKITRSAVVSFYWTRRG